MRLMISPSIRLTFGLVLLTLSILIFAQALGLIPSGEKQALNMRQQMAETLATQASVAISYNNALMLSDILNNAIEANPQLLSAAVRKSDNTLLTQTKQHPKLWPQADPSRSTPTHIRLFVFNNGRNYGQLELSFTSLADIETTTVLGMPRFIALVAFICAAGFIGFWFFIRRALKYLDPNAVVPARVKNALNILSEGVIILDKKYQIVLANNSLLETFKTDEKHLLGRKIHTTGLVLSGDEHNANIAPPWVAAFEQGEKQHNIRMLLQDKEQNVLSTFMVNVVPIQDDRGNRQGCIVSLDDVSELEQKNNLLEDMIQKIGHIQIALEKKNRELDFLASRDPLTGCFNRRSLFDYLNEKFDEKNTKTQLCCIMTDIDHFKNVNDTYGHSVGDEIIKMVSSSIQDSLRDGDIVARYGGEEFCIVLPRADIEEAFEVADRCRKSIASKECSGVKVTSSFGVTTIKHGAKEPQELITQADEALYVSKENGRNQVNRWRSNKLKTPKAI